MNTHHIALGVNIDHIATIRQARRTAYPSIGLAARAAIAGGADGITIHLREDRRHIQDADLIDLMETLDVSLNLELGASAEMVAIACRARPAHCCLVPERRAELTTEGGLDVCRLYDALKPAIEQLTAAGICVSLFIDPDAAQVNCAARLGVPAIELHTGRYAEAFAKADRDRELGVLISAASMAAEAGLQVNAGHGLNYANVAPIAAIPHIRELNIGHAIVAQALFSGLEAAVRDMKRRMLAARR